MRAPVVAVMALLCGLAAIVFTVISKDVASQRHFSLMAMVWLIVYMQASDTKRSK